MENSTSETEEQKSFRSPPRRRRSTFFERRDSFVPQTYTENIDTSGCKKNQDFTEKQNQELSRYYEKLLSEKEQWKKEVNNRRHRYHDLRQQYQIAAKSSSRSRISYNALSNEDIEFLKGKPNLSKLIDSQLKLHKSVKETQALFRRVNQLDDVILSNCEDKVNDITEYILENSTLETME